MKAIIALLLMTAPALAQTCGPHDEIAAVLKRSFGEAAHAQAMSGDGRMMELFANPETGTWTAVMTKPDGTACMVAGGHQFRAVKPGDPA